MKGDPKQGVSSTVYHQYAPRQDIQPGDVLFVRDGTYLVGSTAIVGGDDLPMLLQSHVLRFRVVDGSELDGFLFLAAMNAPVVRRQLRSKQFTADIIDTVGSRYREVYLPIPNDAQERARISAATCALQRTAEANCAGPCDTCPSGWKEPCQFGEFGAMTMRQSRTCQPLGSRCRPMSLAVAL